jgi:hypothetical protein
MDNLTDRFTKAIEGFDDYNYRDPHVEEVDGKRISKEVLYAQRMTARLSQFAPDANEAVRLAARCQHIGRWEILRNEYPEGKKGYLLWRAEEKQHHAKIAEGILKKGGYDTDTIEQVKFLLLKKELKTNADTQLLEDVICLVFIEFYLEEFAAKHENEKVIDIIKKTTKKMSAKALEAVGQLTVSAKARELLGQATSPAFLFQFEEAFMKDDIRCIPMIVRFKLDGCGIKLKLAEWNKFTVAERSKLASVPTASEEQLSAYRKYVQQLVLNHAGSEATDLPIEKDPAWANVSQIHSSLIEKLKEFEWDISLSQWRALTNLQRFVLLKLSRPSHENKNFTKAVKEFGLVG